MYHSYERLKVNIQILLKYGTSSLGTLEIKEFFNKIDNIDENDTNNLSVTFIYLNAIKEEVMYNKLIDKPIENRVESFSIILNYLYDQLIRIKGISINQLDYIRSIIPEQLLAFKLLTRFYLKSCYNNNNNSDKINNNISFILGVGGPSMNSLSVLGGLSRYVNTFSLFKIL
ncbi:hypothetical protein ACTFIZ_000603 [Dictyostelium cf. discoideum]